MHVKNEQKQGGLCSSVMQGLFVSCRGSQFCTFDKGILRTEFITNRDKISFKNRYCALDIIQSRGGGGGHLGI